MEMDMEKTMNEGDPSGLEAESLEPPLKALEEFPTAENFNPDEIPIKVSEKAREKETGSKQQYLFEKFLWFITSFGHLCMSPRDASQADQLVKRYMKPGDFFVHSDAANAPICIIKNPDRKPMPLASLEEAGTMSVCRSDSWENRASVSAWWVYSSQVSKNSPSGEFLNPGMFHIRGKKCFLPAMPLQLGVAVLFRVSTKHLPSAIVAAEHSDEHELCLPVSSGTTTESTFPGSPIQVGGCTAGMEFIPSEDPSPVTTPSPTPNTLHHLGYKFGGNILDANLLTHQPQQGFTDGSRQHSTSEFECEEPKSPAIVQQRRKMSGKDRRLQGSSRTSSIHSTASGISEISSESSDMMASGVFRSNETSKVSTFPDCSSIQDMALPQHHTSDSNKESGTEPTSMETSTVASQQTGGVGHPGYGMPKSLRAQHKLKKIKKKYGEQDEDERKTRMQLLGNPLAKVHQDLLAVEEQQRQQMIALSVNSGTPMDNSSEKGTVGPLVSQLAPKSILASNTTNMSLSQTQQAPSSSSATPSAASGSRNHSPAMHASPGPVTQSTTMKKNVKFQVAREDFTMTSCSVSEPSYSASVSETPSPQANMGVKSGMQGISNVGCGTNAGEVLEEKPQPPTAEDPMSEFMRQKQEQFIQTEQAMMERMQKEVIEELPYFCGNPEGGSDEIQHALLMVAPYGALLNYRYKAKISPGKDKRGVAAGTLLSYFLQVAASDADFFSNMSMMTTESTMLSPESGAMSRKTSDSTVFSQGSSGSKTSRTTMASTVGGMTLTYQVIKRTGIDQLVLQMLGNVKIQFTQKVATNLNLKPSAVRQQAKMDRKAQSKTQKMQKELALSEQQSAEQASGKATSSSQGNAKAKGSKNGSGKTGGKAGNKSAGTSNKSSSRKLHGKAALLPEGSPTLDSRSNSSRSQRSARGENEEADQKDVEQQQEGTGFQFYNCGAAPWKRKPEAQHSEGLHGDYLKRQSASKPQVHRHIDANAL